MSLHITAQLFEDDLRRLLTELLPSTVDLDPFGADAGRRWIRFEAPQNVDFMAKQGLRVRTSAALQWTALGIKVPVTLNEVTLLIEPMIGEDERGPKLVFRTRIEQADFRLMPTFVDQAITSRINAALEAEGDLLGWHVGETLLQKIPMPKNLKPVDAFQMQAGPVSVEVQEDCFTLRLEVQLKFSRNRQDEPVSVAEVNVPADAGTEPPSKV